MADRQIVDGEMIRSRVREIPCVDGEMTRSPDGQILHGVTRVL
jgi:hypothetical protein